MKQRSDVVIRSAVGGMDVEKRKLSAIPRPIATPEMMEVADRLGGMRHIVTAELIDDKKILLLNFL